jgi:hypothetical protein
VEALFVVAGSARMLAVRNTGASAGAWQIGSGKRWALRRTRSHTHPRRSIIMSTELAAAETETFAAGTIQAGSIIKNSPTLTIYFTAPFATVPTVVISPFWPNGSVPNVETITAVSTDQFTVSSSNAAANYSVNWIAFAA